MKPSAKAIAVVTSVVVVAACLVYALIMAIPGEGGVALDSSFDQTGRAELDPEDRLEIKSSLSGVTVSADDDATEVTARLHGSAAGFSVGGGPELIVERNGGTVSIRTERRGAGLIGFIGWSSSLKLDVVIPASFAGDFSCESSAGPISVEPDLAVGSFYAHSSAGAVRVHAVKAGGSVEVSSSAGPVETGAVEAASANIHTSAGRVNVQSCVAGDITLHSSAGSVTAGALEGRVNASSSAGPVEVALMKITGDSEISSSAGGVRVSLPKGASADVEAWSSAGRVTLNGLELDNVTESKRDRVTGRLGEGGPKLKAHSSAGPVELRGE